MENATKALLIAAAVLVAIIIISLTLVIVRQGQEAVAGVDMSEAEVAQFNSKFNTYHGKKVSTSQANAILSMVFMHNKEEIASGNKRYVTIQIPNARGGSELSVHVANMLDHGDYVPVVCNNENQNISAVPKLKGNNYYQITCSYDDPTGLGNKNSNLISYIKMEKSN